MFPLYFILEGEYQFSIIVVYKFYWGRFNIKQKRRCEWCGKPLNEADKRRKYHTNNDEGVECSKEARRWKKTNQQWNYDKNNLRYKIGGLYSLSPDREEDYLKEAKEVSTVLLKLGLESKSAQYLQKQCPDIILKKTKGKNHQIIFNRRVILFYQKPKPP